jgi:hypothetical protein
MASLIGYWLFAIGYSRTSLGEFAFYAVLHNNRRT